MDRFYVVLYPQEGHPQCRPPVYWPGASTKALVVLFWLTRAPTVDPATPATDNTSLQDPEYLVVRAWAPRESFQLSIELVPQLRLTNL